MAKRQYRNFSFAEADALLRYEPATGRLFWRVRGLDRFTDGKQSAQHNMRAWNGRYAGREAFTAVNASGHRVGHLFGYVHQAHRVAWLLYTGVWPTYEIDHIDQNPANNRISNLRDVPHAENLQNQRRRRTNISGTAGVSWYARDSTWEASIKANGTRFFLGRFTLKQDAIAARKDAETRLGFHKNHGSPNDR